MSIIIGLITSLALATTGLGLLAWWEQRARARRIEAMQDRRALARRIVLATAGEHVGAAKLWLGE